MDEFDELQDGGIKACCSAPFAFVGNVVHQHEAILRRVADVGQHGPRCCTERVSSPRFFKSERTASAAAHAQEINVSIQLFTNFEEVPVWDVHDGIV